MEFSFPPHTIHVNMPDTAALLAEVRRRFRAGQGFALATINLDHLVKLRRDPVFAQAYAGQDLVCADGNPIVWLSRLARRPVSLVPGSDMILPLAHLAAREGVSVALMGSTDEALAAAAAGLQERVPELTIAATIAPPMGFDPAGDEARAILRQLAQSGAGLTFVALGAPKQEVFAALGRQTMPGLGFASIGAGLDFIAGRQTRAPEWVRAIAMEWLWRAAGNPRRLAGRYLRAGIAFPGLWLQAGRKRG